MTWSCWRFVPYGLAVVSSACTVGGLVLAELAREQFGIEHYVTNQLSFAIAFGWAGAWLMPYPKARVLARLLLICALADGIAILAEGVSLYTLLDGPLGVLLSGVSSIGTACSVALAFTVLPQAFPAGPMPSRPWPAIFRTTTVLAVLLPLCLAASAGIFGGYDAISDSIYTSLLMFLFVGVVIGTASLVARWREATPTVRSEIRMYAILNVLGLAALVGTFISSLLTTSERWLNVFIIVWPVAVVAVIAVSALSTELYDIRIVVRRAAIYAVLAFGVAFLFVSVYFVVLLSISQNLDRSEYRWVAFAAGGAAVVLLEPVRRTLRDLLERQLLGDRGDPLRALDQLNRRMSGGDPDLLYTGVVESFAAAVRSPGVVLRLQRDGSIEQVASTGTLGSDVESVPLISAGERLGAIEVSRRTPGESFSAADSRLLQRMAHEAAAVVQAKRRDRELAGARRQAVDAVIDERSRLGRDLHDDLAPLLAGASLSLEALRRRIPVGSAEEREASQLADLLRHTATNTRRLAYDLQPPEFLSDFSSAVTTYLTTLTGSGRPSFRIHATVDGVPQSLRHTAYRVVLEAVNNVVQHARADNASVSVTADDALLRVEIVDDGVGLDQPYLSGIGISSMRRRVESAGGTFAVSRVRPHGTRVIAQIPVTLQT